MELILFFRTERYTELSKTETAPPATGRGNKGGNHMKTIYDVPIILRREIEALMVKPFIDAFEKELGHEKIAGTYYDRCNDRCIACGLRRNTRSQQHR